MDKLNQFFKQKTIQSVLDVGTGPGNFIPVLKEALPNARITAVDPNTDSLSEAKKIYPDVIFKEMVGEHLDFVNNTFDVATISMALHHLPDIEKSLKEMQRVVKPGGWIIVNELFSDNLNSAQEVHKQMHHFRSKIDRLKGISHNETLSKNKILELIEKSGLEILLHFENREEHKKATVEDINERSKKMKVILEDINGQPEYHELENEISNITAALLKHGFEMATRIVIVGAVN